MKLKMLGCVSIAQLTSAIQKFFSGILVNLGYKESHRCDREVHGPTVGGHGPTVASPENG